MCSASVNGGPAGGETLLLGLASGLVLQVFVSNPFPVELVKAGVAVVCCDMSLHRKQASILPIISRIGGLGAVQQALAAEDQRGSGLFFWAYT